MKTVSNVRATPHLEGQRIELRWTLPTAAELAPDTLTGIRVVRRERTFPETPSDGNEVYDGAVVSTLTDAVPRSARTYYYTVFARVGTTFVADTRSQASAVATTRYGHARDLYDLLPAIHHRLDSPLGPLELAELGATNPAAVDALAALGAELQESGQLRRFLDAAAAPLDLMRGLAEALPDLHDADFMRPEFLPIAAAFVGWDLDRTLPVYAQRNEVKAGPRLHRRVGTIPSLRELVTRYTTWHSQVAELAQYLFRSNHPPQLNLFSLLESAPNVFRGTDDAALLLGLPVGVEVRGSGSTPATLVGSAPGGGTFALRPGMELAVTTDDRLPVVTRFEPGDFATIGAATPVEVAMAVNRTHSELSAAVLGGALELRSHSVGPDSALKVEEYATTLVGLEPAPRGRPSVLRDLSGRLRVFYETADPLEDSKRHAADESFAGRRPDATSSANGRSEYGGRVRYKTLQLGEWSPARSLTTLPLESEGDPVVLELLSGDLFVAWIASPGTAGARIRFTTGTPATPAGACVRGSRTGPFGDLVGRTIAVRGNWEGAEGITFSTSDFPAAGPPTTAEVVTALSAGLARLNAFDVGGAVELRTTGVGGREQLELDLVHSSAAAELGFDATNASAVGSWGDEVLWTPAADVTTVASGRQLDLSGVVNPATGHVWLFWARHDGVTWQLAAASWDGTTWTAPTALTTGSDAHREPFALLDGATPWVTWALRRTGEIEAWTIQIRRFDFATGSLAAAAAAVTTAPAGTARLDREPAAVRRAASSLEVFFRSDRAGGTDLWRVTVTTGAMPTSGAPTQITSGPFLDGWPAPVLLSISGPLWLLYRSDRSVPLSRVASRTLPQSDNRVTSPRATPRFPVGPTFSVRAPDTGAVRRFVGSTTVPLDDLPRIRRLRLFDDPLAYTPMGVEAGAVLDDGDLYTRGTVALYLSRLVAKTPLSDLQVQRLKTVLRSLLPINVRPVVILAPRVDIEFVYGGDSGHDLQDLVFETHPDIDYYTGLLDFVPPPGLPNWLQFLTVDLSATPTPVPSPHRSGDPANLNTLSSRTHHDPYQ